MAISFTELCIKHVYPLYTALYSINKHDSKLQTINTMLFNCNNYMLLTQNEYIDLSLKNEINLFLRQFDVRRDTLKRFEIDDHLYSILYKCADLLVSHNALFTNDAIYNEVGRVRDHYTN